MNVKLVIFRRIKATFLSVKSKNGENSLLIYLFRAYLIKI